MGHSWMVSDRPCGLRSPTLVGKRDLAGESRRCCFLRRRLLALFQRLPYGRPVSRCPRSRPGRGRQGQQDPRSRSLPLAKLRRGQAQVSPVCPRRLRLSDIGWHRAAARWWACRFWGITRPTECRGQTAVGAARPRSRGRPPAWRYQRTPSWLRRRGVPSRRPRTRPDCRWLAGRPAACMTP
jgi:hypothetical protein